MDKKSLSHTAWKCQYQIVLSTHSPLLLGDMPQHNVIYLRTNDETGITEVDNSGRLETFGQNIHLILRDSFFLLYLFRNIGRKSCMVRYGPM